MSEATKNITEAIIREKLEIEYSNQRTITEEGIPKVKLSGRNVVGCEALLDRISLLRALPEQSVVAEIGVAAFDFSRQILQFNRPQTLHLIDNWEDPRWPVELAYKFASEHKNQIESKSIRVHRTNSVFASNAFPDNYFDWIYLDTSHDFKNTWDELISYENKIKPNGIIAGHDYTQCNFETSFRYGVIEATHKFCAERGWRFKYITMETIEGRSFALTRI